MSEPKGSAVAEVNRVKDGKPAKWPDHFPDDCPSCESPTPCGGPVFRFHKDPHDPRDAESHAEKNLSPAAPPCQRAGLSCNTTIEGLKSFYQTHPYLKTRKIARAVLSAEHGCFAQTGARGHITVWLTRAALGRYFDLFKVQE